MSNSLAIAAVTATLRNLIANSIASELGSGVVTTQPPDKARDNGNNNNQLNLFLYHILPNSAFRNADLTLRVKPGETAQPPLPLNLYYLITAYGKDNDDISSHRLLGKVMQFLHDFPILNPRDIQIALGESELQNQIERVRIVLAPISLEETSKLWSTFQTQYRISASYEVSVVLIDSNRAVKAPLPVLTRGSGDSGVIAEANLTPPFPTLESLEIPNKQFSVRLGESFTLKGHHLDSDDGRALVLLSHPRLNRPFNIALQQQQNPSEITVSLPEQNTDLPAGFYSISVKLLRDGKQQTTNALPLTIAPQIEITLEARLLTIVCRPEVWRGQYVALLLGDREILPSREEIPEQPEKTDTLIFDLETVPSGEYFVRLRVDGVDSLLINRSVTPPVFDSRQKVVLQ